MRKQIGQLNRHIVVAGAGSTGKHVIDEMLATKTPFVVIDRNKEHLERMAQEMAGDTKLLFVHGDATEDHVLVEAGIARATGVVAALTHDKDNLYVTLSARALNATARIVAKVVEEEAAPKMLKAGATSIVGPTAIRRAKDGERGDPARGERVPRPDAPRQGQEPAPRGGRHRRRLAVRRRGAEGHASIRRDTRLLVIAVRLADREFVYNPEPDFVIGEGTTCFIVMGETESVVKLRSLVGVEVQRSSVVM